MIYLRICALMLFCFSLNNSNAQSDCIDASGDFGDLIDAMNESSYDEAVSEFQAAILNASGNEDDGLNACLHYHYATKHFREGNLDSAYNYFSRGAEYLIKSEHTDSLLLHKLRYNSGIVRLRQRQPISAVYWFKAAREMALNEVDVEKCHIKIARCYQEGGDLYLANHYLKIAVQKLQTLQPEGLKWLIEASGTLGINYNEAQQPDSALYYLQLQRDLINANSKTNWVARSITNALEMGNAYETMGDYDKAIHFYKTSLKEAQHAGDAVNQLRNFNNLGYAYNRNGQFLTAIVNLRKSRHIAANILQDSIRMSYIESNIGDTYLESGGYDKAINHYYNALVLITPGFKSSDFNRVPPMDQIRDLDYLHEVYGHCFDLAKGIGISGLESGNISLVLKAMEYVELADSILFQINSNSIEQRSRFFWRSEAKALYTLAIDLSVHLEDFDAVFHYLERNKYFVLRNLIRDNSSVGRASTEDQQHIGNLQEAIASAEIRHLHHPEDANIRARIIELKEDLHHKMTNVIVDDDLMIEEVKKKSLEDFRGNELTNDSTLYISYHLTDEKLYQLYICNDSAWMEEREMSALLNFTLRQFLHQVVQPFQTTTDEENFYKNANYLYRQLFSAQVQSFSSLVINPDGILNYLPFDALCSDHTTWDLVIDNHTVRYSLTPFIQRSIESMDGGQKTLIVAPISFGDTSLPSLPYTELEARNISRIVGAKTLTGQRGTKQEFLEALPEFDVIHLATHAQSGHSITALPWLSFTDDKMYLPEIYHLPLENKFVVLSACETFKGEEVEGEGILNLVWALHHGGTRNVVATLWNAYDNAQNDLMELFYADLKAGYAPDEALRQAKLKYRKDHRSDPCYWASPIYIGQPVAIQFASHSPISRQGIILLLVLLASAIFIIRHW